MEKNRIGILFSGGTESTALIKYYKDKNYLSIQIFFVRNGLLVGRHEDIVQTLDNVEEDIIEYIIKF